jgi:hypothetical protein
MGKKNSAVFENSEVSSNTIFSRIIAPPPLISPPGMSEFVTKYNTGLPNVCFKHNYLLTCRKLQDYAYEQILFYVV